MTCIESMNWLLFWWCHDVIALFFFALSSLSFRRSFRKISFSLKWEISIRVLITFHEVWPVSSVGSHNWYFQIFLLVFNEGRHLPHKGDQCIMVFISETLAIAALVFTPRVMSTQHLLGTPPSYILLCLCVQVVILPLTRVPATCSSHMTPKSAQVINMSLIHVAATCPHDVYVLSWWATFNPRYIWITFFLSHGNT